MHLRVGRTRSYSRRPRTRSSRQHHHYLGVQSRGEMGWIEVESIRLFRPDPADMFVGREALEGLEALGEIVGVQEAGEMRFKLVAGLVVVAPDCRLLDRTVHAF